MMIQTKFLKKAEVFFIRSILYKHAVGKIASIFTFKQKLLKPDTEKQWKGKITPKRMRNYFS